MNGQSAFSGQWWHLPTLGYYCLFSDQLAFRGLLSTLYTAYCNFSDFSGMMMTLGLDSHSEKLKAPCWNRGFRDCFDYSEFIKALSALSRPQERVKIYGRI